MKRTNLIRSTITLILLAIFALPAFSFAANDENDPDDRWGNRQNFKDRKFARHERMAEMLGLSDEQQVLFDSMHDANRNYADQNRGRMRGIRSVFKTELAKENPDFNAAVNQIKQDYGQNSDETLNAMLAAKVSFYESLTPEQRQKCAEMRGKRGKSRGFKRGNGQGRGQR